ncbi:MAG: hypothetical protein BWY21_00308 [Parcubacteria group bacterium ADurb.Bin216]|nr:MAG: hypothetical protein BWY21_00308 [Parcubacteria group bacterium ADurb.Bin216]
MKSTLRINTEYFLKDGVKTISHSDQKHFINQVNDSLEKGLKMMIEGAEIYIKAYQKENGSLIGEDHYVGAYMQEILHGIHKLLSGQGRFDGGTISKTLCELAENNNLGEI